MARPIYVLTHDKIMTLPPGRHADGAGLYLQVTQSGKSWLFRYDLNGGSHWMGLGKVDTGHLAESLATARQRAQDARAQIRDGRDPLAAKRAARVVKSASILRARKTFTDCAREYMKAHRDGWRSPIHARQWEQ